MREHIYPDYGEYVETTKEGKRVIEPKLYSWQSFKLYAKNKALALVIL